MKRPVRLFFVLSFAAGLVAAGCASTAPSSGNVASATPGAPVELEGTRWKLPTHDGKIDGRTIEFKRSSDGRYIGALVELGKQLQGQMGGTIGNVMLELWPTGKVNEFNGIYRKPNRVPIEATYSVSADGKELKCSEDDGYWLRAS